MTLKHCETAARIVRKLPDINDRVILCAVLIRLFRHGYPNFDEKRFIYACGL